MTGDFSITVAVMCCTVSAQARKICGMPK